jgi:hypothetical protein
MINGEALIYTLRPGRIYRPEIGSRTAAQSKVRVIVFA